MDPQNPNEAEHIPHIDPGGTTSYGPLLLQVGDVR